MKTILRLRIRGTMFLAGALGLCSVAVAHLSSNSGSMTTPPSSRVGADASPLTSGNSMAITNSQELADFKAFLSTSDEQLPKKIKAEDNFLKKYSESVCEPKSMLRWPLSTFRPASKTRVLRRAQLLFN